MSQNQFPANFIKIFGTAGARVAQCKQLRASGGAWLRLDDTNLLFDPGPGTLVHCWAGDKPLNPGLLDGVILSHRHLDHSNDFNVMVEAMVEGGFKPHGIAAAPSDALNSPEPIFFHYLRPVVDHIYVLEEGTSFQVGQVKVSTPVRHYHPVETYGFLFSGRRVNIAVITDTRYFPQLGEAYKGADLLILNVTFLHTFHSSKAFHLSIDEIGPLIEEINPQLTVLTHFGARILEKNPTLLARDMSRRLNRKIIAAYDGMILNLDDLSAGG